MKMKTVIAIAEGFHEGALVPRGTIFDVREALHGKWFVPYTGQELGDQVKSALEPYTLSEMARRSANGPSYQKPGWTAKGKKSEAAPDKKEESEVI